MGAIAKGHEVTFWDDENVLKSIFRMVAQSCAYTKKPHRIVQLKWVTCMVCELYFNKIVIGERGKWGVTTNR